MPVEQQGPPLCRLRDLVTKLDMDTDTDTDRLEPKRVVDRDASSMRSPGTKSARPSKRSPATSCTSTRSTPETITSTIDSSRKGHDSLEYQYQYQYCCDGATIDCAGRVRRREQMLSPLDFEGGKAGGSDLKSRLISRALLHTVMNDRLVGSSTGTSTGTSTSIASKNIQHSTASLGSSTSNRRAALDSLMSTTSSDSLPGRFLSTSPSSKDEACPRALSYSSSDMVSSSSVSSVSIPVKNVYVVEIQKKHEPAVATPAPVDTVEEPQVSKKCHKSSTKEVTFSAREIRKCVFESVPESVRQQIPPEAWDRIFNEADSVYSDNFAAAATCSPPLSRLAKDEVSDLISVISVMISKEVDQDEGQHSVFSDFTEELSSSSNGRHLAAIVATSKTSTPKTPPTAIDKARVFDSLIMSARHASGEMFPRELSFRKLNVNEEEEKPSVKFHAVHVRYYERILSDNPAVTEGPSVGLGWKYKQAPRMYHIDEWEDIRGFSRRSSEQLVLPRYVRTTMLIELGYSHKEIADMIRKSLRIKHNRLVTVNNLRAQKMEEFMEKTTRKLKKLATLVS
jgi:hypothetical protein